MFPFAKERSNNARAIPPTTPEASAQTTLVPDIKWSADHERQGGDRNQAADMHDGGERNAFTRRAPTPPRKSLVPHTATAARL